MKITRRVFFVVLFWCAMVTLTFTGATSKPGSSPHQLALIGTYTSNNASKGIYIVEFDSDSGTLKLKGVAAETPNPSWVLLHPNGKYVYAANESGKQSTITSFSLDPQTAKLAQLNQLPAQGEDPCYLSFDKTGKFLFVANYTSGTVAVFPILSDGKLGPATSVVKDGGPLGPNKERQEGPHAHWIEPSLHNRFVYVADLGLDRVLIYPFNSATGTLSEPPTNAPSGAYYAPVRPGDGPRHAAFSANGQFMFVLGEVKSAVTVFSNQKQEAWQPVQEISTLPELYTGRNDAAEIVIHPDGKWLFVSNRGRDSIAVFAINLDGTLRKSGDYPTGGQEPRHFALDPSGHFLLAENQNSNSITVFRIDPATGALSRVSNTGDIPSPVCLAFLPNP